MLRYSVNPNTFAGLVGKVGKKLSPEGGRRVEKKAHAARPPGPGLERRALPRARRGSPTARQGAV